MLEGSGGTVTDLTVGADPLLLGGGTATNQPAWTTATYPFRALTNTVTGASLTIALPGSDPNGRPLTASIIQLPAYGSLYQTPDGLTLGAPITHTPSLVTDAQRRVIYVPPAGLNVLDRFRYTVNNGLADSAPASVVLNAIFNPNSILTINAPTNVTLLAGASSNLVIQITADYPILQADFVPTNPPPAFVSVASRSFGLLGTNGTATVTLQLNPLHDAAGSYVLSLGAVAQNGASGVVNIPVTVLPNPALTATHWTNAVSGNWSDASKWSAGLPTNGTVAVIDAVGTYTVTLDTSVSASGIVLNQGNAVLSIPTDRTINAPIELRAGQFALTGGTLTLNSPLVNLGTMRWPSGYNTVALQGSGCVENEGLWEVGGYGGGWYNESWVRVPVSVTAGATLQLDDNARLAFGAGSSLGMAGTLLIGTNAQLHFDNSTPARDLTFLPGSAWSGPGTTLIDGTNRVVIAGNVTLGGGLLSLVGGSVLAGTNLLTIANGATLQLDHSATFPGSVTVDGTLTLASSGVTFGIQGTLTLGASGTINNPGAILAGAFADNGGAINGNAPAGHPLAVRIIRVALAASLGQSEVRTPFPASSGLRTVNLDCLGAPGQRFILETSLDLLQWRPITANFLETSPGRFHISAPVPDAPRRFFRLRIATPN